MVERKYQIEEIIDDNGNSKFYPMYKDSNVNGYLVDGDIKEFQYFTEWIEFTYMRKFLKRIYFETPQDVEIFIDEDNYKRNKSMLESTIKEVRYHEYKPSNIVE